MTITEFPHRSAEARLEGPGLRGDRDVAVFTLTNRERQALIRVLYVIKDNWSLDETEDLLLVRLESTLPW
jgi:hypothetical protein